MSDRGWVFQVNRSAGGVPKLPAAVAEVTADGLAGDRQSDLRHHGGPERAVCLYSPDRILDLQREGHPIFPGAIGENLTLAGLYWDDLGPGARLEVGAGVELEVTRFTTPCRTIAGAFAGGAIERILQDRHPGWSRLYARALRSGTVRVGDRVKVVAGRG